MPAAIFVITRLTDFGDPDYFVSFHETVNLITNSIGL
jgi:hypothetical protein